MSEEKTLKEYIEIISDLFNYEKDGTTICWSLCQWTDGMWSVNVIDSWHQWIDKNVPELKYKYGTPLIACKEFLKHINKHNIEPFKLQDVEVEE